MWPSQISKGFTTSDSRSTLRSWRSCCCCCWPSLRRRRWQWPEEKKQEKWANFFEKPQPTPTSTLAKNQKKFFGYVEITWRFQDHWLLRNSTNFHGFQLKFRVSRLEKNKHTGPKHDPFPLITCDETAGRHMLHQWNWKWMCQGPQCVREQEISMLFIAYYAVKYIFNHVIG